ncbi:MAG: SIMPL domain-containing protein [Dehalococcoidia bacterium]
MATPTARRGALRAGAMSVIAAAVLAAVFALTGAQTAHAQTAEEPSGIHVTGNATTTVEADRAIVELGVEAMAPTVEAARDEAAAAMDDVTAALTAAGIPRDNLPTSGFRIQPQYGEPRPGDADGPRITGFIVTNLVSARIDDIDRVGEIIDAAVAAGGDLIRVQDIRFEASDQDAAFNQALEDAVQDARATAQRVASLTGVQLGAVRYVAVSGGFTPPRPLAEGLGGAGGPTPIQPQQIEVNVSVTITYAIAGAQ